MAQHHNSNRPILISQENTITVFIWLSGLRRDTTRAFQAPAEYKCFRATKTHQSQPAYHFFTQARSAVQKGIIHAAHFWNNLHRQSYSKYSLSFTNVMCTLLSVLFSRRAPPTVVPTQAHTWQGLFKINSSSSHLCPCAMPWHNTLLFPFCFARSRNVPTRIIYSTNHSSNNDRALSF
jgi:hypothetical protein